MKRIPVQNSEVLHIKTVDDANFRLDLYAIKRSYRNRWVTLSNSIFNDQIAVFEIPIKKYKFNNLVMDPVGSDEISADANLYFNTMFFDSSFIATTGVIDNKDLVNAKRPSKKRIGIDKITSHVSRHSFAYYMLSTGATVEEISFALGHASIEITQSYIKQFPSRYSDEAIDRFGSSFSI